MSLRKAFQKLSDIFHLALGIVAGLSLRFSYGWIISLAITLIFMIYQSVEIEKAIESYIDMLEYVYGFILGLIFTKA